MIRTLVSNFSAQNEKKLVKLQQQNAALADNAQRRAVGQQVQQNQVEIRFPFDTSNSNEIFQGDETVESLRRQIRLLEDKLRKTRTAERPLDEPKVKEKTLHPFVRDQQITFLRLGRTNAPRC